MSSSKSSHTHTHTHTPHTHTHTPHPHTHTHTHTQFFLFNTLQFVNSLHILKCFRPCLWILRIRLKTSLSLRSVWPYFTSRRLWAKENCFVSVQQWGTLHEDLNMFYCCWRHLTYVEGASVGTSVTVDTMVLVLQWTPWCRSQFTVHVPTCLLPVGTAQTVRALWCAVGDRTIVV